MKSKFAWFGILVLGVILSGMPAVYAAEVQPEPVDSVYQEDHIAELEEIAANREAVIEELVQMWFMEIPDWEAEFRSLLNSANDSKLLAILNAERYAEVQAVLSGGTLDFYSADSMGTPFALGDPDKDYVYTPVKPCRIIDTRKAGGKIPSNSSRNFYVHGAGTLLTPQGGNPAGCIAPRPEPGDEPRAAHINIVAVDSTGRGYLTVWPKGTTRPLSSVINYEPGKNDPISNAFTVKTGWHVNHEISIYASKETHVVADVLGYYYDVDENDFKVRFAGSRSLYNVILTTIGGCTNHPGGSVSIYAPGPGKITVNAQVELWLKSHTSGMSDSAKIYIGDSAKECGVPSASEGYYPKRWQIPTFHPSWSGNYQVQPIHVSRTFTVTSAGTKTYYLNCKRDSGSGELTSAHSAMQATYYPDF